MFYELFWYLKDIIELLKSSKYYNKHLFRPKNSKLRNIFDNFNTITDKNDKQRKTFYKRKGQRTH